MLKRLEVLERLEEPNLSCEGEGMAATYSNPGPQSILDYFAKGLHTGRGPGLDDAIIEGFILEFAQQPAIEKLVSDGRIVFEKRAKVGRMHRNIDLVLGPPPGPIPDWADGLLGLPRMMPAQIRLGGEVKSIMTEHGKAQRNRRGDMEQHANAVASVDANAVSIGVCLINAADEYYSHTAKKVNVHGNGRERARRAIEDLNQVPRRNLPAHPYGLDVLCTPVVIVTNSDGSYATAKYLKQPPAPPDGDDLSWPHLIAKAAELYRRRFPD